METTQSMYVSNTYAVLGMDIVSFSTMFDNEQVETMHHLMRWIKSALEYHDIGDEDYRWSPAGDGGYLTFKTLGEKAIDVAYAIWDKARQPMAMPRGNRGPKLRMVIHAGPVIEGRELGRDTNMWGFGVNTASRILSICASSQILVSTTFFNTYIKDRHERDYNYGERFTRTVKHGAQVEVMNVSRNGGFGLDTIQAAAQLWSPIGAAWQQTVENFTHLIHDAQASNSVIAGLAAAKFLLNLNDTSQEVKQTLDGLFAKIGALPSGATSLSSNLRHQIFNRISPTLLEKILTEAKPRLFRRGEIVCRKGDSADSCYFPVYGEVVIETPSQAQPIRVPNGDIIGEFALWIPQIKRTATVRVNEDSLLLEVANDLFLAIFAENKDVEQVFLSIIEERMIKNVTESPELFPGMSEADLKKLKQSYARFEKHQEGEVLDLDRKTYILYHGKVRMRPLDDIDQYYDIETNSHFGPETVVGIVTNVPDSGQIDGKRAKVLSEAVSVNFPHHIILALQNAQPEVRRAWYGMWGVRQLELMNWQEKTCRLKA